MAELQKISTETAQLATSLRSLIDSATPAAKASLENMGEASERLAGPAVTLERILTDNEASLSQFAGSGLVEMQQLMIDLREVSAEVQGLARSLRDNPSSLLLEQKESGVEIAP